MQAIDGVAGLIPEVGGLIAMLITGPITAIVNEATVKLSAATMTGMNDLFKKTVRSQLRFWVKQMAKVAGGVIEDIKEKYQQAADHVEQHALALIPVDDLVAGVGAMSGALQQVMGIVTPLMEFFKPVISALMEFILPGLSGTIARCERKSAMLTDLFERGLCPGSDSDHSQPLRVSVQKRGEARARRGTLTSPPPPLSQVSCMCILHAQLMGIRRERWRWAGLSSIRRSTRRRPS